ncbi:MAG: hypothetical protein ABIR37_04180 [Candidatus Saccharimonadales bacterium]
MAEPTPKLTMEHMLADIEPRVLLGLTLEMDDNPDTLDAQAKAALESGALALDVLVQLQTFVATEQRKVPRKNKEELQRSVACVVLAHIRQEENNKARRNRKKIPH